MRSPWFIKQYLVYAMKMAMEQMKIKNLLLNVIRKQRSKNLHGLSTKWEIAIITDMV